MGRGARLIPPPGGAPRDPRQNKKKKNAPQAKKGGWTGSSPRPIRPTAAVFTYYLRDELKSRKDARREREKRSRRKGGDTSYRRGTSCAPRPRGGPGRSAGRDRRGGRVGCASLTGPVSAGFPVWPGTCATRRRTPPRWRSPPSLAPWERAPSGPLAAPGTYQVSLARRVEGKVVPLDGPGGVRGGGAGHLVPAARGPDRHPGLPAEDRAAAARGAGAGASAREAQRRLDHLKQALHDTPGADPAAVGRGARDRVAAQGPAGRAGPATRCSARRTNRCRPRCRTA